MQVEHSSAKYMFNGAAGANANKYALSNAQQGSTNESQPKIQYLTPTCIVFTYDDGDIGALLDEHFQKSLNSAGKAPSRHRNLPPSFWNRHYAMRSHRHTMHNASSQAAAAAAAANSLSYYQADAYSSLLRSQQTAASLWSPYPSSQALAAAAAAAGVDGSGGAGPSTSASAYGLADGSATYNPFLSLTRQTTGSSFVAPNRLPAPPQYTSIRNDPWSMEQAARDFGGHHAAVYPFSGLNASTTSHHFSIADTVNQHHQAHPKDVMCFPSTH